jgi:hypothetical protein
VHYSAATTVGSTPCTSLSSLLAEVGRYSPAEVVSDLSTDRRRFRSLVDGALTIRFQTAANALACWGTEGGTIGAGDDQAINQAAESLISLWQHDQSLGNSQLVVPSSGVPRQNFSVLPNEQEPERQVDDESIGNELRDNEGDNVSRGHKSVKKRPMWSVAIEQAMYGTDGAET